MLLVVGGMVHGAQEMKKVVSALFGPPSERSVEEKRNRKF